MRSADIDLNIFPPIFLKLSTDNASSDWIRQSVAEHIKG